jgi:hypothetical protein
VITLLAIIGESSVAGHAQTITASKLCLLPRIIPAPQALLRTARPQRLPEVTAKMAGVYNGIVLDSVGFFANIMHPLDEFKPFSFKVLEISHTERTKKRKKKKKTTGGGKDWFDGLWARTKDLGTVVGEAVGLRKRRAKNTQVQEDEEATSGVDRNRTATESSQRTRHTVHFVDDVEQGQQPPPAPASLSEPTAQANTTNSPPDDSQDQESVSDRPLTAHARDMTQTMAVDEDDDDYNVPPRRSSPEHFLSVFSFLLTIAIIALAAYWHDGTAIVAIVGMALASTVICYASWWRPVLMHRNQTNKVPKGDVVIRTREGAFLLVKCTEEVARELYSGTEECEYVVPTQYYRAFMGLGMFLLMVSVVLLGNCGWESQAMIGGSYILLNALYWLMSLLPDKKFWDLSRYKVKDITPKDALNADKPTNPDDPREGIPSFTRTLWYAVRETKKTAWVERSGAMPGTKQWRKWLDEAIHEAKKGNRAWEAVRRKNEIMKEALEEENEKGSGTYDAAEQAVPLSEVQPMPLTRRETGGL